MDKRPGVSLALLVIALLASAGSGDAASGTSARSLRGTYGFSGSGTLLGGAVQAAIVGLNSFDRASRCDIAARINAFAAVTPVRSTSCSYTVNPDGTGSIDITLDSPMFPGIFHSDFVIVDNAKEIHFMLSHESGGVVATGISKRQTSDGGN